MSNSLYQPTGLKAWIDLSTFCNAACPQCHRTDPNGLGKVSWLPLIQWTLEEFKKKFPPDSLKYYESFEFCGTWGDPMMNKDIFEIIQYLIDFDPLVLVSVNTNGSIRDPDWWWKLGMMGGGRLEVIFDIDGTTQEMHSKYRRKTDLSLIKDNVEAYCTTRGWSTICTIVFDHNKDALGAIEYMCRQWGVKGQHIIIPSNRFKSSVFSFTNEKNQTETLVKAIE